MKRFLKKGGYWFLPLSWQAKVNAEKYPIFYYVVKALKVAEKKIKPIVPWFWTKRPNQGNEVAGQEGDADEVENVSSFAPRLRCCLVSFLIGGESFSRLGKSSCSKL